MRSERTPNMIKDFENLEINYEKGKERSKVALTVGIGALLIGGYYNIELIENVGKLTIASSALILSYYSGKYKSLRDIVDKT